MTFIIRDNPTESQYTLSILLLGCVGCIHSPPLRTFSARRGIRSFAALPKNKLVRVYTQATLNLGVLLKSPFRHCEESSTKQSTLKKLNWQDLCADLI